MYKNHFPRDACLLFILAVFFGGNVARAQPSSPSPQSMQMRLVITEPSGANICLPFGGSTDVSVRIYWGDGAVEDVISATAVTNVFHQYNFSGTYDIHIDRLGIRPQWLDKFGDGYECWHNRVFAAGVGYLDTVTSFGDLGIRSLNRAFSPAYQLSSIPSELPSTVTDLGNAFTGSKFNHPLPWNVSQVTNMEGLFAENALFNQSLSDWDVSSVTSMRAMFYASLAFNQPILGWNVGQVTDFSAMFSQAASFNSPIGSWNTSSATKMAEMFFNTTFNQGIENWDVSKVTSMDAMFALSQFNQPLEQWDVGRVEQFVAMFAQSFFNQSLNSWNMVSARFINRMFTQAYAFNQPLDQWDTSSVIDMNRVFEYNAIFNQPLNSWNVSNVENFSYMFRGTVAFDQPLDSWNVQRATTLDFMFLEAASFQQNISMWCAPRLTSVPPESFAPALPAVFQPSWTQCLPPPINPPVAAGPDAPEPVSPPVNIPFAPPVSTPVAPPGASSPVASAPVASPLSLCSGTSRCITESVVIGSNSSSVVAFENATTILGDLRVTTSNATIVIAVRPTTGGGSQNQPPPVLQISGCVTFGGSLNVTISESVQLSSSQEITLATYEAGYCDGGHGQTSAFSSVAVDLGCRTATSTTAQYNPKSLSLVFGGINSDNCPTSVTGSGAPSVENASFPLVPVIAGCVAAVVAVSIIIGAVVYWRRKNRFDAATKSVRSRLTNAGSK